MNIDQYLGRKGSLSLTELSTRIGVSKSRLSQLRYAKQLPPELALNLERETDGAVDASKFSKVVAEARGKVWKGDVA